jgi:hypothetical protein
MPKHLPVLPQAARRAIAALGADINEARRRRRLPLDVIAARALTTRQTVARIERGDPRVAIGTWAAVLYALGLVEGLGTLAEPTHDAVGHALDKERLPRRARLVSRMPGSSAGSPADAPADAPAPAAPGRRGRPSEPRP